MRGRSHFRVVSRAVNYFLFLARCYWMIVAIEICTRSKMGNEHGGPVECTVMYQSIPAAPCPSPPGNVSPGGGAVVNLARPGAGH